MPHQSPLQIRARHGPLRRALSATPHRGSRIGSIAPPQDAKPSTNLSGTQPRACSTTTTSPTQKQSTYKLHHGLLSALGKTRHPHNRRPHSSVISPLFEHARRPLPARPHNSGHPNGTSPSSGPPPTAGDLMASSAVRLQRRRLPSREKFLTTPSCNFLHRRHHPRKRQRSQRLRHVAVANRIQEQRRRLRMDERRS